jgi:solute carrier family 13 (sodium-dependent dicarboxylate transporter), member 2/3/5
VVAFATLAIALWLTQPLHHISAPVVSLGLAAALFSSGLLRAADIRAIDWSTLLLIAGGLALGHLLQHAGVSEWVATQIARPEMEGTTVRLLFILIAALLASVMSNTATATMLVPLALTAQPHAPTLAILVALGTSLGMPFLISTPANALAYGRGLRSSTLFAVGSVIMILGWLLISLTGARVLALFWAA